MPSHHLDRLDPQDVVLDQYIVAALIQLTHTDDVVLQPWVEVDAGERLVLYVLPSEQDGATAKDVDHQSISETDGAHHTSTYCSQQ